MSDIAGTGDFQFQLSVTMGPPAPAHAYLGVARAMMPGVQLLATPPQVSPHALALVTGHVLECLLKAYLSRGGSNAGLKHHNLEALWSQAATDGLGTAMLPPQWVVQLNGVYDGRYTLRYSEGVNGIVLPPLQPMVEDLGIVLETVNSKLT